MSGIDSETRSSVRRGNRLQGVAHLTLAVGFAIYVAIFRSNELLWWGIAAVLLVTGLIYLGMTSFQLRAMAWAGRKGQERHGQQQDKPWGGA